MDVPGPRLDFGELSSEPPVAGATVPFVEWAQASQTLEDRFLVARGVYELAITKGAPRTPYYLTVDPEHLGVSIDLNPTIPEKAYWVASFEEAYEPPELLEDPTSAITARGQVYIAGVYAHIAITGRHPLGWLIPFTAPVAVLEKVPDPVAYHGEELPEAFQLLFDQVLAKDPSDRLRSCEEARDALDELRRRLGEADTVSSVDPPTVLLQAPLIEEEPEAKKGRGPALALLALVMAVAGVGLGYWAGWRPFATVTQPVPGAADPLLARIKVAESLYRPPSDDPEATLAAVRAYDEILADAAYDLRAKGRRGEILEELLVWAKAQKDSKAALERLLVVDPTFVPAQQEIARIEEAAQAAQESERNTKATQKRAKEARAKAEKACASGVPRELTALRPCTSGLAAAARYGANASFVAKRRAELGAAIRKRAEVDLVVARTRGAYDGVLEALGVLGALKAEASWVATVRAEIAAARAIADREGSPEVKAEKVTLLLQVAESPGAPVVQPWAKSQLKAYLEILELDPGHELARRRSKAIRTAQLSKAQAAFDRADPAGMDEAHGILVPLSSAFPADGEVGGLLNRVQAKREAFSQVARLELLIRKPGGQGKAYGEAFIDGESQGYDTVFDLAPGRHEIRVEVPAFAPWTSTVEIAAGDHRRVVVELETIR